MARVWGFGWFGAEGSFSFWEGREEPKRERKEKSTEEGRRRGGHGRVVAPGTETVQLRGKEFGQL